MQREKYRGFITWGHVIREQHDILEQERVVTSGTLTKDRRFVEAGSGVLCQFDAEEDAQRCRIAWARSWVDNHT